MNKIIPIDKLIDIYKMSFYIRQVEQIIADNYHLGLMRCPTHLSIGQELTPAVLSLFNNNDDVAVSTHRAHGHYLGKGGCLKSFFDELHGLETGCSSGNGGSMHLQDNEVGFAGSTAIVGNTLPVGVGIANALKLDGCNNFVYIFLGDAATEEGVFYESLHYSKLHSLPCLFVIENNQYSVYTSLKDRQYVGLEKKMKGFNVDYIFNDNNNYSDLYFQFSNIISQLRNGKGPFVIEIMTHRYREHCGPNFDDNLNYRTNTFLRKWEKNDLINLIKNDLLKRGLTSKSLEKINSHIIKEIDATYNQSKNSALEKL